MHMHIIFSISMCTVFLFKVASPTIGLSCIIQCLGVFMDLCEQGPVSERRLSENSEYVNPEMMETLGFPFQNGR